VLAATATGMALVCGALPLVLFFAAALGAYALPRVLREPDRWPLLGALAAAAAVGLLIAMAQIVPTVAHIPYSPRQLATDYQFASSYAWSSLSYLATLVAPDVLGTEERTRWFGQFNHWEMAGYYAGVVAVLLAPLGARRKRPELIGLGVMALVGILLAFGDLGPLHGFCFRHVPLYATLRCPTRALVMFLFAVPVLAAEGLAWLLARPSRPRTWLGVGITATLGLAAALAYRRCAQLPHLLPSAEAVRDALVHMGLVVVAAGAALVLWATGILRPRAAGIVVALIALGDLFTVGRASLQPRPRDWARGTERFAAVDWLLAQHPTDRFAVDAHGPFRLHNLGMTYGIEGAVGYDSVSIWRYVNFLYVINNGAPYPGPKLLHDLAAGDIKRFGSPLVDLLDVRWVVAPQPPAPGWVERFHPTGELHARHEPQWDWQLRVYENPHPMPRAFVLYRAELVADDAQAARRLAGLDPRKLALVDRALSPPPVGDDRPLTPAELVAVDRHHLVIDAQPSAPGLLVMSETDYPGWSATVDGRPAELVRADYALRGVALGAGRHRVELRFRSRPTELGLALSLLGLLGLGLLGRGRFRGHARSSMVHS
jgi:hypothetical protein